MKLEKKEEKTTQKGDVEREGAGAYIINESSEAVV